MRKSRRPGLVRPILPDRFRGILAHVAVPIWVADISRLRGITRRLHDRGVSDLRGYLARHPRALERAVGSIMIVDVNRAAMKMLQAARKEQILGPLKDVLGPQSAPALRELILAIAEGRREFDVDAVSTTRRGRRLDLQIKTSIPEEDDEYPDAVISAIDVSEHKRLEQMLTEERVLLRAVIDNIPDQIFLKDTKSRYVAANLSLARWAGVADPAALAGKSDLDFFPARVARKFRNDDRAILTSGKARLNIEEPISSSSGAEGWALTTKVPLRDQTGRVTGLIGIVRDITERKRFEQQVLESEEKYHAIFTDAPVGIFRSTASGKLVNVNPAFARMMGYESPDHIMKEANARSIEEVLYESPEDRAAIIQEVRGAAGWHRLENRYRHREGRAVVTNLTVRLRTPAGATDPELEGFVEDITEQRRAEKAAAGERALLQTLMDTMPDLIYFKDSGGRFILTNKAHARLVLLSDPSEMIGKTDFDFFLPEPSRIAFEDEQRVMQTGHPIVDQLEKKTRPDRPDIWISTTKMPLRNEQGQTIGTFGISRDVTERRQMEEKNLRLAAMIESSKDAIVGVGLDDTVISWNRGAEEIFGYSAAEMVGMPIMALLSPDAVAEEPAVKGLSPRGSVQRFESLVTRKNGAQIYVSSSFSPIVDENGRIVGIVSISRDVTHQRALQAQILRSQRLESLATLAAGIAHQFNNANAVIQGYLDVLAQDTTLPSATQTYVREALKGVRRVVEITERLQGFTGTDSGSTDTNRLEEMVPAFLHAFKERLDADKISVTVDFQETPAVRAGRTMVNFIVTSLMTNSIHALLDCPSPSLVIRTRSMAGFSCLEVRDTGCGIDPENLPRIFTPFFSTKGEWAEPGSPQSRVKGIGLSLAVCQSTVAESGGWIEVESVRHQGSTFRVWLPSITPEGTAAETAE